MSEVLFTNQAAPPVPPPGKVFMFVDIAGNPSTKDEFGTVSVIGGGGGGASAYPYLVGLEPGLPYSVIQTAIDDAAAAAATDGFEKEVFVRPGTYTEDLTFRPGVHLVGGTQFQEPFASTMVTTMPTVVGNHTVDVSAPYSCKVQGFEFLENSTVSPIFSLSGVGFGGQFSFGGCVFRNVSPCTAPMVVFNGTDAVISDLIGFDSCLFSGQVSGANLIEFDGSSVAMTFRDAYIFNFTDPDNGINIAHTLALTQGFVEFIETTVDVSVVLDSNGVTAQFDNCAVKNDGGTAEAINVGATSVVRLVDTHVESATAVCIDGAGLVEFGRGCSFSPGLFGAATQVGLAAQTSHVSVRGEVQDVAVAGPTLQEPLTKIIRVSTNAIGAPSTVHLLDPDYREGQLVIVWDVDGGAPAYHVTVACPAASVTGHAVLNKAHHRLGFISDGNTWLQVMDEN